VLAVIAILALSAFAAAHAGYGNSRYAGTEGCPMHSGSAYGAYGEDFHEQMHAAMHGEADGDWDAAHERMHEAMHGEEGELDETHESMHELMHGEAGWNYGMTSYCTGGMMGAEGGMTDCGMMGNGAYYIMHMMRMICPGWFGWR